MITKRPNMSFGDDYGGEEVYTCDAIRASRDAEWTPEYPAGKWYFGREQAEEFGDLICENLAGKTISKRVDLGEQPGGLVYEAEQLGIDMWDLLEALEGLCHQGRAREIDDSTYLVTCDGKYPEEEEIFTEVNSRTHLKNRKAVTASTVRPDWINSLESLCDELEAKLDFIAVEGAGYLDASDMKTLEDSCDILRDFLMMYCTDHDRTGYDNSVNSASDIGSAGVSDDLVTIDIPFSIEVRVEPGYVWCIDDTEELENRIADEFEAHGVIYTEAYLEDFEVLLDHELPESLFAGLSAAEYMRIEGTAHMSYILKGSESEFESAASSMEFKKIERA